MGMEYRSKKPGAQDFAPSYEEDSVMDAGAMSSLIPLKVAQENGFVITKPKRKITLQNASGKQMGVQGLPVVWARAKGARTYSKIVFIVSEDAQELLVSFKDQVLLRILPANYPYFLGETQEEIAEFAQDEDIVAPYDDDEDQEAQVVYRVFAKILEHQVDSFILGDQLEEKELIQDLHEEEEEMIKSKSSLE